MNGFRYLVIGLDYDLGQSMGQECPEPPCPFAIPTVPTKELEPQFAQYGFDVIKTDAARFQPQALGGMEFASNELATFWLASHDGQVFQTVFKYVFVARVSA